MDKMEADITCHVQQLASMFLGYQRPQDLYKLEMIEGNARSIEKLEQIIPRKQTYFPDFF